MKIKQNNGRIEENKKMLNVAALLNATSRVVIETITTKTRSRMKTSTGMSRRRGARRDKEQPRRDEEALVLMKVINLLIISPSLAHFPRDINTLILPIIRQVETLGNRRGGLVVVL